MEGRPRLRPGGFAGLPAFARPNGFACSGHTETKLGDWSRRSWKTKLEASHLGHE